MVEGEDLIAAFSGVVGGAGDGEMRGCKELGCGVEGGCWGCHVEGVVGV